MQFILWKTKINKQLKITSLLSLCKETTVNFKQDKSLVRSIMELDFIDIMRNDLYAYTENISHMQQSSIQRKLTAIMSFIKFSRKEYGINIEVDLPKLKKQRKIPKTISNQDFKQIKQTVEQYNENYKLKVTAIIETLYSTGMRASELVRLKFINVKTAINGATNGIIITGKGNKERLVFLTLKAKESLKAYCTAYKINSGFLWASKNKHLTRQGLHKIIATAGKKASISVSTHSIRHRLAVNLTQNGMELMAVQKLLGHSHINTTAIYTALEDDVVHQIVEQYHPLGDKSRTFSVNK